jgi:hypothetical protein
MGNTRGYNIPAHWNVRYNVYAKTLLSSTFGSF